MRKAKGLKSPSVRVTFELPAISAGERVEVLGDWNGWQGTPMKQRKDGRFSVTVLLPKAREYRYRYLVDGCRWENDWSADGYVPNPYGGEDCIVAL